VARASVEGSRFFEKKRRKKLLLYCSRDFPTPQAQRKKVFLVRGRQRFSSEKDQLAFP
jgi:hypothetical protein